MAGVLMGHIDTLMHKFLFLYFVYTMFKSELF